MLYLVPTPIGNLDDITLRALDTLKAADYVLAEDTRTTGKLFKHHNIQQKLRAFHAHNEHKTTSAIIGDLLAGMNVALVSDAGTPGLSDPGFLLVRACHEAEVQVTCLPGATALIPAVVLSGFPSDRFSFEGFLPHKKGRQTRWQQLSQLESTFACYESPHRLLKFLREANEYLQPERQIAVVREISKVYESVHRGNASELIAHFDSHPENTKGEIVIVVCRVY